MRIAIKMLASTALFIGFAGVSAGQQPSSAKPNTSSTPKTPIHTRKHAAHRKVSTKTSQRGEAQRSQVQEAGFETEPGKPSHATLKTGQWNAKQAAKVHPKQTSLRHSAVATASGKHAPSAHENAEASQPANKDTHEIHLKKHNARMF